MLSETHSVGKAKAKFLRSAGFNESNVDLLKKGLLDIALAGAIAGEVTSVHGVKYVIDGQLQTPTEDVLKIRTVWIIDQGQTRPRLVTAYPARD